MAVSLILDSRALLHMTGVVIQIVRSVNTGVENECPFNVNLYERVLQDCIPGCFLQGAIRFAQVSFLLGSSTEKTKVVYIALF